MNEPNQFSHRDSDMSISSQQQQHQQYSAHRHSSHDTASIQSAATNGALGQTNTANIHNKKQRQDMSTASLHANNNYNLINEFNSYNEETIHKVIFSYSSLFFIQFDWNSNKQKTILVGDSGVGKTSVLVQFDQKKFQSGSFSATVGIGFTVSFWEFVLQFLVLFSWFVNFYLTISELKWFDSIN